MRRRFDFASALETSSQKQSNATQRHALAVADLGQEEAHRCLLVRSSGCARDESYLHPEMVLGPKNPVGERTQAGAEGTCNQIRALARFSAL